MKFVVAIVTNQDPLIQVEVDASSREEALGKVTVSYLIRGTGKQLLIYNIIGPLNLGDDAVLREAVIHYLNRKEFINAIKHVRSVTGMGLKEGKEFVEKIKTELNI